MSGIAAPADKRFRRVHVKPARRRRWRTMPVVLGVCSIAAVVVLYGLVRLSLRLTSAAVFRIERIDVRGNERLSAGEVLAVVVDMRGESIFRTDLEAWRRRLSSLPWVRDVALRRVLPATVDIVIAERRPIGVGRIDGELYLIDERGVVIDQYGARHAGLDLPLVDGLGGPDGRSTGLDQTRAALAAGVITAVSGRPDIARRLSQLDVGDPRNASVILSGDPAVIQIGNERFLSRLSSYLELLATLRQRVPDYDYADLRFDDRIYVRSPERGARSSVAVQPSKKRR